MVTQIENFPQKGNEDDRSPESKSSSSEDTEDNRKNTDYIDTQDEVEIERASQLMKNLGNTKKEEVLRELHRMSPSTFEALFTSGGWNDEQHQLLQEADTRSRNGVYEKYYKLQYEYAKEAVHRRIDNRVRDQDVNEIDREMWKIIMIDEIVSHLLEERNPYARAALMEVLGEFVRKSPELAENNDDIRSLKTTLAKDILSSDWKLCMSASKLLHRIGGETKAMLPTLSIILRSKAEPVTAYKKGTEKPERPVSAARYEAMLLIQEIGEKAEDSNVVSALRIILHSGNDLEKNYAASALVRCGESGINELNNALRSKNSSIRLQAMGAVANSLLGLLGRSHESIRSTHPALIALLEDNEKDIQVDASIALSKMHKLYKGKIDPIDPVSHEKMRKNIEMAMRSQLERDKEWEADRTIDLLLESFIDADLKTATDFYFSQLNNQNLHKNSVQKLAFCVGYLNQDEKFPKEWVTKLAETALHHPDPEIRSTLVQDLCISSSQHSIDVKETLLALLDDSNLWVRFSTINAIFNFQEEDRTVKQKIVDVLPVLVTDSDLDIERKANCLSALYKLEQQKAINLYITMLNDPNVTVELKNAFKERIKQLQQ